MPCKTGLKVTIHKPMLRDIHNERRGMSTQLNTDMPVKDMMQLIQQGEFADFKVL